MYLFNTRNNLWNQHRKFKDILCSLQTTNHAYAASRVFTHIESICSFILATSSVFPLPSKYGILASNLVTFFWSFLKDLRCSRKYTVRGDQKGKIYKCSCRLNLITYLFNLISSSLICLFFFPPMVPICKTRRIQSMPEVRLSLSRNIVHITPSTCDCRGEDAEKLSALETIDLI